MAYGTYRFRQLHFVVIFSFNTSTREHSQMIRLTSNNTNNYLKHFKCKIYNFRETEDVINLLCNKFELYKNVTLKMIDSRNWEHMIKVRYILD